MLIKISDLEKLILDTLLLEYPSEQANLIKEVILFGELSGRPTHGILRLLKGNYGAFVDGKRGEPEFINKTKLSTVIDGHNNPGMLIAPLAMQEGIRLAKENGIGIVGTRGSFNSTGSLTYYLEKIVNENLIGIIFTQSIPVIAPFNTKKALFGSNPIGFAIPSNPKPIIFDMSTSAITYGSIMKHKAEGKELPANVAIDAEGNLTTDPIKAAEGATLPFDSSYKGSGLAMIIELLGSLWTGASFEGLHSEKGWGNLFMVFPPELLSDERSLKRNAEEFINTLRNAPTIDGKQVRIPGENTLQTRNTNLQKGEIEVNGEIIAKIKQQLQ